MITFDPLQGLGWTSIGRITSKMERGNYNEQALEDYDYIKSQIRAENPRGRLVMLEGTPGTGKTFLIKSMMREVQDVRWVYMPSNIFEKLESPEMLRLLMSMHHNMCDNGESIVLVCEDAEELLLQRDMTKARIVSTLLNMADGILGEALDIRIIATVNNLKGGEFDAAAIRKGRLIRHSVITPIDQDQATQVLRRLTGNEELVYESEDTTLGAVYDAASEYGWVKEEEEADESDLSSIERAALRVKRRFSKTRAR
jgi:ATP-dependent 26S proteasome regulatory subunit